MEKSGEIHVSDDVCLWKKKEEESVSLHRNGARLKQKIGYLQFKGKRLVLIQLRDDEYSQGLVETAQSTQTLFIRRPVHTNDRLRRDDFRIE
mmetsp:Transcript_23152/g.25375  ORF Transcript_23152/g.25375 Transcript_23152/m.25375 type:complete len:92 (+) Transcript_23152:1139-1414(+)